MPIKVREPGIWRSPILLFGIHPIEDSQKIYAQANEPKELFTIEDANHVFSDDSLDPMVEKVVNWTKNQFALISWNK